MSKRDQSKKEYGDCKKTKSPACCSMRCCGNHFGIIGAANHVRKNTKAHIRRYHRHAIKPLIKAEVINEIEYMQDEIAAYEPMMDE